jgi:hypothetical protein
VLYQLSYVGDGLTLASFCDRAQAARAVVKSLSEEAMRRGDEALNAMNPPGGVSGKRPFVEFYEVPVQTIS